ncbi:MAG TPA: hypothetical protein VMV44_01495 [Rectinemataceae bacterium]|nr:hypothetical protein [Rectinemataceae bacterium]
MSRAALERTLDFILNEADEEEFEVVRKACERRMRDGGAFASLGSSSSTVLAKKMAASVEEAMGSSLDSVRKLTRGFVADIILKNEPDIGEEDLEALLEHYLPTAGAGGRPAAGGETGETGGDNVSDAMAKGHAEELPLPAEMLLYMTRDFVSFSEGSMAPSRQKELWDEMPRWQDDYWKALPPSIKAIVKAYLEGRMGAETFTTALLSILGL